MGGLLNIQEIKNKRSYLDIIADILRGLNNSGKASLTKLIYYSGLPYPKARKYIEYLLTKGLIRYSSNFFQLTEKGFEYIKVYQYLLNLL